MSENVEGSSKAAVEGRTSPRAALAAQLVPSEGRARGRALAEDVADAVGLLAGQYDHGECITACGSPACVAGFTVWVMEGYADGKTLNERYPWSKDIVETARLGLEMTPEESDRMFRPTPTGEPKPTGWDAERVLRRYAEEGIVSWM